MNDSMAPPRTGLTESLLAQYQRIPASTVGHFTDSGYLRGIRPLFDNLRMVGKVVTVKLFTPDGSILREALLLSEPGDVLVVECVGDPECACWGELRTLAGLIKGVAGVVVCGAVTDVVALRAHRLPVFSRSVSAFTTRSLGLGGEVNQPIQVSGVTVRAGDIALGDDDGVFILSVQQAIDLLPNVLAKEQADQLKRTEFLQRIQAPR
ncbi:RraA family protein [Pseudomonas sp. Tri1]|uniref:RraA family protein n=1 Tax=Pseudomonas sp. Tri1 TaxID=2823875 RepID=UPI001B31B5E0|nr:RraA family protein [Pseudomonas sp. Tri1]